MKRSQDIGIYDAEIPSIKESTISDLGNSQITEPDIIITTYNGNNNPVLNNNTNTGNTSSGSIPIEILNPLNPSDTSTGSNSSNTSEPSATTDDTKTYVDGGTTPDSTIVIKKSNRKYFVYGGIALIVGLIAYKVFYNKNTAQ